MVDATFLYLHVAKESCLRVHMLRFRQGPDGGECLLTSPPGEVGSTSSGWHGRHDWTKGCCSFQVSLHYAGEAAGFCRTIKFEVLPSACWVMTHMRGLSCYIGTHSKQQWCMLVAPNDPDRLGPAMSMPPAPTRPPPRPPAHLELYNADGAEIVENQMRGLSCYMGTHSKQPWCTLVPPNDPDRLGPSMSMLPPPTRPPPRPPAHSGLYNADGAEIVD